MGKLNDLIGFGLSVFTSIVYPVGFKRALSRLSNDAIPNDLLPVGEYVKLLYRERGNESRWYDYLRQSGLDKTSADELKRANASIIDVQDLIDLKRRTNLTDDEFYEKAYQLGYSREEINKVLAVRYPIPTLSDIIMFAVREAYDENFIKSSGYDTNLNIIMQKAANDLKNIGVKPEDFAKYWYSHWQLPSPQMGFEMVHRGIIPIDSPDSRQLSLRRLLIASDYAPGWIDNLIAISYTPYTRVDIRRMHKVGILSAEQVYNAYKDIGYNDEKARNLTNFTILLNDESKNKPKEKDLTKTDLINGYKDSVITRLEAKNGLIELGYDSNESEFYLKKADIDEKQRLSKSEIASVKGLFQKGIIDKIEAKSRLAKLNIDNNKIDELLKLWDIDKKASPKIPTVDDFLEFYRRGLIDKNELQTELKNLGYSEKHVTYYINTV